MVRQDETKQDEMRHSIHMLANRMRQDHETSVPSRRSKSSESEPEPEAESESESESGAQVGKVRAKTTENGTTEWIV